MPRANFKGDIDLTAVRPAPEDVTTLRKGQDLSQYEKLLADSWNVQKEGKGAILELPIPSEARTTVESRLRQAAAKLGVGVATGDVPHPDGNGLIILRFQAKEKVARKTPTKKDKAPAAAGAGKGLPKP